jgi:hypothetical protein
VSESVGDRPDVFDPDRFAPEAVKARDRYVRKRRHSEDSNTARTAVASICAKLMPMQMRGRRRMADKVAVKELGNGPRAD